MAVKMRLMRMGKKKHPIYRVVVVDGRAPRDGRYIEQIGRYAPLEDPSMVEIDNDKAAAWLSKGAQPTEAVEKLLNISGAMNTMKVRTGQIHTVGGTAPVEPTADAADETAEETVPIAVEDVVADEAPASEAAEDSTDEPASADTAASDADSGEEE